MTVILSFRNGKTEKEFCDHRLLVRGYGPEQAKLIEKRLNQLAAADHLGVLRTLPQIRAHELAGDRKGQISLDVKHPYRLLIVADHDKPPLKPDGGLDWTQVTRVKVLGVEDTHE
jgi:plasmid maintenance system killer protein